MPIIFKLVGIRIESSMKNEMYFENFNEPEISFEDIKKFFLSLGFTEKYIEGTKFIIDSETIHIDKSYKIESNEQKIIYVFTMETPIKQELIKIFSKFGFFQEKEIIVVDAEVIDENISKPIPEDEIQFDDSIIEESNLETIKLFKNENFNKLLKIFIEEPELFKTFSSYIISGDVNMSAFNNEDESHYFVNRESTYEDQVNEIMNLNLDLEKEHVEKVIKKFKGHINLSLRYLLCQNALLT